MSVLRELTLNHMAITPSMECAQIEARLDVLYDHFHHLMSVQVQSAETGCVSMESLNFLETTGYSTEAADGGKTLIQRIWQGIKNIFTKIKEFLGRLLEIRKRHLKGNDFKIEKLKKYIQNIDMSQKPQGTHSVNTTLLPEEAAHALSAVGEFRNDAKHVMEFRGKTLRTLAGVDLKTITEEKAKEIVKGLEGHETKLSKKQGSHTAFKNNELLVSYGAEWENGREMPKVEGASVITMNSLVKAYEDLAADDAKYLGQIAADRAISNKFLQELDKLMEANTFRNIDHDGDSEEEYHEKTKRATSIWTGCRVLSIRMVKVDRLVHSVVFDVLYSDIEEILQKSLGQYKFKKAELHEEDRHGDNNAEERRYREQQAREKEAYEKHRDK